MDIPHFLCLPLPIQGHVNPLMQFSLLLAKHGCKVTFVHTEFSSKRANTAGGDNKEEALVKMVTLPDGLDPQDDRSDVAKLLVSMKSTMPALLPKLIQDIDASDVENKITCIIVTINMGWALEVGNEMGIKGALLCPASATSLASAACIPNLIEDGIIDSQGLPTKNQEIQLSSNMPTMDTAYLPWRGFNKIFFEHLMQEMQTLKVGEWWLCNTTYDLEPGAFSISPKFLPIGPLKENSNRSSFWEEDRACLEWLDEQPPQSVVYVSFGSLAVMDPNQFKELALALDLLHRPFIWVVRPSNDKKENVNAYPHDFHGSKGKIVGWAPQKKILNHPSLACFISHCGWNSTLEGICAGVPFLCWPCTTDQFLNKSYICDVWKIGVGLEKNESGIVSREEIKKKVNQLLVDEEIKGRSLKLKEMTINNIQEGGQSSKNLNFFMDWAK
ncbi:UDP-glycosyltransferase 83A1-like [Vigna umbellata]|uniref:UDP-glycosyltransferase 83A1-like n=1 Tax=Vigna umbellata TaxID=87088 RepID=UPI001F5F7143|nr:UDP-glycosyltransferase 83A1-like [Vigna umbellata]